ncbi:MAG: TonB-dependent receptor [Campylobacter sp.]|nr:TonB-dependent receptor [Campylobacter sp.]
MSKFKLALSVCVAVCSVGILNAEEQMEFSEIVVTSSAFGIDADKVNVRNAAMIRDIMRDIPGVYVGGTNGLNQKLYIRGINDRGLNITIDGARQKGNAFHHAADLYLDADIIKSVDVGLGVNSVVGASGALGGSVAFKTVDASDLLEPGQVFGGKIKGDYASNNEEWQQSLSLYGQAGIFDLLGYVGHRGYNRGKDANDVEIGGNGDDTNYMFKLGANLNDSTKITGSLEHFQIKGDYPMRAEWPSQGDLVSGTKYYRDTYTINLVSNPNDFIDLDASVYYTDHTASTQNGNGMNSGVKTAGGKVINKTLLGDTSGFNQTFVYGFEYYEAQSYNDAATPKVPNDKAKSLSIFAEDQMRYGGLTFTPGIRFDRYELNTMGGELLGHKTTMGRGGPTTTSISSGTRAKYTWNEWSPGVLVDYQFNPEFGLYASWAKVFRGPDVIESIRLASGNVESITTNPDLKPETGDVYEFGTRYQTQITDNQNLSLSAKYFYNDYDNLIVEMGTGGQLEVQRVNGSRAVVKGAEISARYNIYDLSLGVSYSRARTDYKDNSPAGYGGVLAYSDAGDKWTFNAEYFIAPIDVLVGYNLIAFDKIRTTNGSGTEIEKPGYGVSDIYATWMPDNGKFKGLEVNFGVYNLFDKAYWSHSQRSANALNPNSSIDWEPGRNIKASVSYKF